MSHHQNAGQNQNINTDNKSYENMTKFHIWKGWLQIRVIINEES